MYMQIPVHSFLLHVLLLTRGQIRCKDGFEFYLNFEIPFVLTQPDAHEFPRGGILCQEMGMGKTVEMLALINANPSELAGNFPGILSGIVLAVQPPLLLSFRFFFPFPSSLSPFLSFFLPSSLRFMFPSSSGAEGLGSVSSIFRETNRMNLRHPKSGLLETRGTLIVVPTSLLAQWELELQR